MQHNIALYNNKHWSNFYTSVWRHCGMFVAILLKWSWWQ